MNKKLLAKQSGFAHLHLLILIALIVAAISFVGGYVYNAQKKRNDAANQAAASNQDKPKEEIEVKTEDSSEKTTVEVSEPVKEATPVPAKKETTTTTKKKTEPTYTYVTIASTSADVGAENVVFTATLPGTYTGYCKTMVKLEDGSNEQWFDTSFGPANTCSVTVSRSKLTAGTTWKYYMYLKTSDGLTKGESAYSTFALN